MQGILQAMENLKLTALEEAIMLAILDKPNYGQGIVDVVSAASEGRYQIGPSTLYPALQRLERRGFIQGEKRPERLDIRNGHSCRYYKVTQKGQIMLDDMEKMRICIRKKNRNVQFPLGFKT